MGGRGGSFSYSSENEGRLKTGYELFADESWDYEMGFWIGQPFEAVNAGSNVVPEFR